MYELNEPSKEKSSPTPKVKMRISGHDACPGCGEQVKRGSVMCVQCGYNLQKGSYVQTDVAGKMKENVIPSKQGGKEFKTHIPAARKVRDEVAENFKADWKEPGIIAGVSVVVILVAMILHGNPETSAIAGYAFSQGHDGHLMSGLMMGLELLLLALISLPLMFFSIFLVNAVFGVSMGTMSALPLKLFSLSLAGIATACCFEIVFTVIVLLFPNANGLLVILSVILYPLDILLVLGVFCAISDRYFEMDYISGTLFYLIGLVIPLSVVLVIAGVIAAEQFSQIAA
ncbi:hypothetical protein JD969_03085 [Planctomycetota bacterium]|nr:hypothetical protein JD969_03085 [Planctomycetota bacterium]